MTDRLDPPPLAEPSESTGGRRRSVARLRRATPFLAGILAAFLGIALYAALFPAKPGITQRQVVDTVDNVLASQTPGPPRSELVFNTIQPSLVLIETDTKTDATPAPDASPPTSGLGSGVVVNVAGQILTALHVVDGATRSRSRSPTGRRPRRRSRASDDANDIAVLAPRHAARPDRPRPPSATRPPADRQRGVRRRQPVRPYGSMSTGVVSGLDRSFKLPDTGKVMTGLIQFDAAVNPGNSGGPLLDRNGQ